MGRYLDPATQRKLIATPNRVKWKEDCINLLSDVAGMEALCALEVIGSF